MPDMPAPEPRITVFIDAANLWSVQEAHRKLLNYAELMKEICKIANASQAECYYYAAYPAEGTRDYPTAHKHNFFTFLKKGLGFTVRKKKLKRIMLRHGLDSITIEKGNMDVELTIDALDQIDHYDVAVLCTGDSDFLALIAYLKQRGKRTIVLSSTESVSRELKSHADEYHNIRTLPETIWRQQIERLPLE